jgi:dihydroneopterin aldolase
MLLGVEPRLRRAESVKDLAKTLPIGASCLWLPNPEEPCLQRLKPSWEVTSDSIAARLALELEIPELLLVKSFESAPGQESLSDATDQGRVDPALNGVVRGSSLTLWLAGPNPEGLAKGLEDPVSSFRQLIA